MRGGVTGGQKNNLILMQPYHGIINSQRRCKIYEEDATTCFLMKA
jgi:hypothetical protein